MTDTISGRGQVVIAAVQDKIVPVKFALTASAAEGTIAQGTMYAYGLNNNATGTQFQVPAGSNYQLVDMYVSGVPAVDAQLIFNLNGLPQGENMILSTMNTTASGERAKITQPLVLSAGDVIAVSVVTIDVGPTAASTDTLFLHFLQVPA